MWHGMRYRTVRWGLLRLSLFLALSLSLSLPHSPWAGINKWIYGFLGVKSIAFRCRTHHDETGFNKMNRSTGTGTPHYISSSSSLFLSGLMPIVGMSRARAAEPSRAEDSHRHRQRHWQPRKTSAPAATIAQSAALPRCLVLWQSNYQQMVRATPIGVLCCLLLLLLLWHFVNNKCCPPLRSSAPFLECAWARARPRPTLDTWGSNRISIRLCVCDRETEREGERERGIGKGRW